MTHEDDVNNHFRATLHGLGLRGDHLEEVAAKVTGYVLYEEELTAPRQLSDEQKADARAIFEGRNPERSACVYCAGLHYQVAGLSPWQQPCPRVQKVVRHTDGVTALEVTYWPAGQWENDVVFPSEVYDEEEVTE